MKSLSRIKGSNACRFSLEVTLHTVTVSFRKKGERKITSNEGETEDPLVGDPL